MQIVLMTAFVIACAACWWLSRDGGRFSLLDHPNARSLHDQPVPRSGGLAIWAGIVVGGLLMLAWQGGRAELAWLGAGTLLVGIISLIDDRSHVPAGVRLLVHLAAGGLLITGGLGLRSLVFPWITIELSTGISIILTLIIITWMINLYNFMDGIDGLAGGMAVSGFGTLGLLGWMGGDGQFAMLSWVIAAAAGGFLVWNFPPARIFMGDSGSSVLGLLAAALSLWGDRLGLFPLWAALLVFSPFIVDATVTLAWRVIRGERFWEAHRNHFYQRLAQADGWGHRRTVIWECALMLFCCVGALIAVQVQAGAQSVILILTALIYLAAILWIGGRNRIRDS